MRVDAREHVLEDVLRGCPVRPGTQDATTGARVFMLAAAEFALAVKARLLLRLVIKYFYDFLVNVIRCYWIC